MRRDLSSLLTPSSLFLQVHFGKGVRGQGVKESLNQDASLLFLSEGREQNNCESGVGDRMHLSDTATGRQALTQGGGTDVT